MKLVISVLISFCSYYSYGQKIDTIYSYGSKTEIIAIKYEKQDTIRKVSYWKDAISSIKYTAKLKDCQTSIDRDTLFDSDRKIRLICENNVSFLSKAKSCDSLLLVKSYFKYKKGTLVEKAHFKRIGHYTDCPCGTWEWFRDDQSVFEKSFISCTSSVLDNLILSDTSWSPDKEYLLEIYQEKMLFSMPGQGSDSGATLILKDKNGVVLKYVSGNSPSDETTMLRDVKIEWDMKSNFVSYGTARGFNLDKY